MRKLELRRRQALPSRWALMVLLACIVTSLFITLNAGAESKAGATSSAAAVGAVAADKAAAKPAIPKSGASSPKPDVALPPKPEESATIEDDPTVAPDPEQSADSEITFPADI
jgi:hypothetical protein